jgi:RNA polymerase sigma factor (sigma-70 family)
MTDRPVNRDTSSTLLWLDRLRASDPSAANELWQRLLSRLLEMAQARLRGASRRVSDEEDIALEAFAALLRGVQSGRLRFDDRDDLAAVLFTLVRRVTASRLREQGRIKRGGGTVRGDSALSCPAAEPPDETPSAEELAVVHDEVRRLLTALPDDELRQILLWRLEGHTCGEIADRLGWATPTIERRLRIIRQTWLALHPDEDGAQMTD